MAVNDLTETPSRASVYTGILPCQKISEMVANGEIVSGVLSPIAADQIQPASIDLQLGDFAYPVDASFLPGKGTRVWDKLRELDGDFESFAMDLRKGAEMTTESELNVAAAAAPVSNVAAADGKPSLVAQTVARLRQTFATGRTRDGQWRQQQLRQLDKMMAENESAIATALAEDLGRKPFEAWLADIATTAAEARYAAKKVRK